MGGQGKEVSSFFFCRNETSQVSLGGKLQAGAHNLTGICEQTEVYSANYAWYIYMYARTPGTL